jgi:Na+/H+ antiporter NhaD/arsenite permease-like protein
VLAVVIALTGLLSAVLTNDVVVFALTPLVCAGLTARSIDARPYLVALAGAANAGSAATLIGNPQNILIGQAGGIDFWPYVLVALPPTLVSLAAVYAAVSLTWRGALDETRSFTETAPPLSFQIYRFQMVKAFVAVAALVILFLSPLPRDYAFIPFYERTGHWDAMVWWVRDHLPHSAGSGRVNRALIAGGRLSNSLSLNQAWHVSDTNIPAK